MGTPWCLDAFAHPACQMHTQTHSRTHAHAHIFCAHGGTQLAHYNTLCFFVSRLHRHTHTPDNHPLRLLRYVCVRVFVCVQPSSLITSVYSVLVCVNCLLLAGPSVLWLQSWWWLLSRLSSLLPPLLWCPPSLTEAKQVHHFSSFGKLTFTNELTLANPLTSVKGKCSVSKFAEREEIEPYYKDFIVM